MTANPTAYANGLARSGINHDQRRPTPTVDRLTTDPSGRPNPTAGWLPHWFSDYEHKGARDALCTVGGDTRLSVRNCLDKASLLSASWIYGRIQDAEFFDCYTRMPLQIERVAQAELIQFDTNGEHRHSFTVGCDTPLCTWDGGSILAGQAREGEQLLGRYGMYVVTRRRKLCETAFRGNFSSLGGIYVGST